MSRILPRPDNVKRPSAAVIGAGNWGTVLADLIAANGHPVSLWCRREDQAREINRRRTNARYLPGIRLHRNIRATHRIDEAVTGKELLIVVIPSKAFRDVCASMGPLLTPDQLAVHATKGFEASTHCRMSEILRQETCLRQLGVLSGPNIAPEVAQRKPAGTVIASRFPAVVQSATALLVSSRFRVYTSQDVLGVELAGALKNVVAIAAGVASELDLGDNAKALLITRGMAEIRRIGTALGALPETFAGVAGLGDLIVTCSSPLSRNFRVGAALARGEKLPEIVASLGMVAEGVNTSAVANEIMKRHSIDAPLFDEVFRVVHQGDDPSTALERLMRIAPHADVR